MNGIHPNPTVQDVATKLADILCQHEKSSSQGSDFIIRWPDGNRSAYKDGKPGGDDLTADADFFEGYDGLRKDTPPDVVERPDHGNDVDDGEDNPTAPASEIGSAVEDLVRELQIDHTMNHRESLFALRITTGYSVQALNGEELPIGAHVAESDFLAQSIG